MSEKKIILFLMRLIVCIAYIFAVSDLLYAFDNGSQIGNTVVNLTIPNDPPAPNVLERAYVIPTVPPVKSIPVAPLAPPLPGAPVAPAVKTISPKPTGDRRDFLAEIQASKSSKGRATQGKTELPLLDEQALAVLTDEQKQQSDILLIDTLVTLSRTCIKPEESTSYPVTLENYKKSVKQSCTELLQNDHFFKRAELREIRDAQFDAFLEENKCDNLDHVNNNLDTIVSAAVHLFGQALFNKDRLDPQSMRYLVVVFAGLYRIPAQEPKNDANKYISNDQVIQAITAARSIDQLVEFLLMLCINKDFLHYKRPSNDAPPYLLDSWLDDSDSRMQQKLGLGAVGASFDEPVLRLLSKPEVVMRKGVKSKELAGRLSATIQKQLLYVDVMEQDDRVLILSLLSVLIDNYQKTFTPGQSAQELVVPVAVTDMDSLLHWETITTFPALEGALRKMTKRVGDKKKDSIDKLAKLIKSNPDNKDEIVRQYDLLFKNNRNKLAALYDTHAKEMAVLRLLRAARATSKKIDGQAEVQKQAELKGVQKGKKGTSAKSLRLQSYQGAQLYKELHRIYGDALAHKVQARFTALFRRGEDIYKLFDMLLKNSVGSLVALGFSKEDFVKMIEPYGLLLMTLEEFNITKNYKKLMNGLVALDTGVKKADQESFDDVINNKEYINDITTYALYKNRLKGVISALEHNDLSGVCNGIVAIVKQAGVGAETTEDFRNFMVEFRHSLLSVLYTNIVNRIQALSNGSITKQEHGFEFPAPINAGWQQRKRDAYLLVAIARAQIFKPLRRLFVNKLIAEVAIDALDAMLAALNNSVALKEVVKKTLNDTWSHASKPENYQQLLDRQAASVIEYLQRYLQDQRDQLKVLQRVAAK